MNHTDSDDWPDPHHNWLLTDWPAAVRIALGFQAMVIFRAAFVAILFPSLLLAAYSIHSHRPILLVWVALALVGFQTSSTCPTGIGLLASSILAGAGLSISVIKQDWLYFASGVLPGATWLAGCTILGITAQYISDAIQSSETIFQTLKRTGILLADQTQLTGDTEAPDHEPGATRPDRDTGEKI